MRKLADGDPETYLAYWKQRQKTVKGALKDRMQAFADQSTKKVAENAADAKAVAEYARTNNHQKYMDYLLGKLNNETDPSQAAKLATQIDTLRSRIFRAGAGGSLAGGVSTGQLADARVAYEQAVQQAYSVINSRGGISKNDPSAAMDITRLQAAASTLQQLDTQIMNDSGAPSKARLDASAEISSGAKATANIVYEVQKASDTRQMSDANFDAKGNTAFAAKIAATMSVAGKAKLYAERAAAASSLGAGIQTEDLKKDLADASSAYQTEAVKAILTVDQTATKLPAQAEANVATEYSNYKTMMAQANMADRDIGIAAFKKEIVSDSDANTFMANLKMSPDMQNDPKLAYSQANLEDLKSLMDSANPAKYDPTTHSWTGDNSKVVDARVADAAAQTIFSIPNNIYATYNTKDPGAMSPNDRTDLLYGAQRGALPNEQERQAQSSAFRQQSVAHGQSERADVNKQPAQQTGAAPIEGTPEAAAGMKSEAMPPMVSDQQAPAENAGPKPETAALSAQPIEPGSNEDFNSAVTSVDTFLSTRDVPDLPDWTAPETEQGNFNDSFPYSTPESAPQAPEAPSQRGQPF